MQELEARELETKIAAWRTRISAALPGREETVRELEAHLRDHIEAQGRYGVAASEAFDEGVARMGAPRMIAREFERVERAGGIVRPLVVVYGLLGTGWAMIVALMLWRCADGTAKPLLVTHVIAVSGGYLAVLAAGLLGGWTLVSGWWRIPSERETFTQRGEIFRMTWIGSVLVPVGVVLGMFWEHGVSPYRAWSWAPVEVGAACVWVSTWLLLLTQLRVVTSDRVRAWLMVLGGTVVLMGWFAKGLTPVVPAGWLGVALILSQGAIALLHMRSKRAAAETEARLAGE